MANDTPAGIPLIMTTPAEISLVNITPVGISMVTAEINLFFTTCHWSVMITTAGISLVNITSAEVSLVSITPAGISLVSITPAAIIIIIMNICKAPTYHWWKLLQV